MSAVCDGQILKQQPTKNEISLNKGDISLTEDGDQYLTIPLLTVTETTHTTVTPDPHDYVSLSPYAWPNPHSSNGLPYIIKDGQQNPEVSTYEDHDKLNLLIKAIHALTTAYEASGNNAYSQKAIELLSFWFVNPATRMNPNLNYAQVIPGKNQGKGSPYGIIDTLLFVDLVKDITILEKAPAASDPFKAGIRHWFEQYLNWLCTSSNGNKISHAHNNQKTWYVAQVLSIAHFVGQRNLEVSTLKQFLKQDFPSQLSMDGSQPNEIDRTKSFDYSVFNLAGLFEIAAIGQSINIDVWHYQANNRASIQKSLDYLIPYAEGIKPWPYKQIISANIKLFSQLLKQAEKIYVDYEENYSSVQKKLKPFSNSHL